MSKINIRRLGAALFAAALLLGASSASTPLSNAPAAAPRGWLPILPGPLGHQSKTAEAIGRCGDATGNFLGMRWRGEVRWRVDEQTIPAYLGDHGPVLAALKSAGLNVSSGRNDCGLPENLAMRQRYVGGTEKQAGVTHDGGCGERDGTNTVSFGHLNPGLLAVTCVWWYGGDRGRTVEADILIDDVAGLFFINPPPGCTGRWDLEGTITHEFGHVYGLGHVPYAQHGDLTMTDGLPDCSTAYRGLGLGDYDTLLKHYGTS